MELEAQTEPDSDSESEVVPATKNSRVAKIQAKTWIFHRKWEFRIPYICRLGGPTDTYDATTYSFDYQPPNPPEYQHEESDVWPMEPARPGPFTASQGQV